jgi:hypothetical protein
MDTAYLNTVRLLLDVAPEVFRSASFAMKGGTALNLFVQDLPRLSVDIDVVYVPHATARDAALAEIGSELNQMRDRLERRGISAEVAATTVGDETKLFARRGRDQVKVEINHVFRGAVLPVERDPWSRRQANFSRWHSPFPRSLSPSFTAANSSRQWTDSIPGTFLMCMGCSQPRAFRLTS